MTHASRSSLAPAVAALCLLPLLASCGQKGPLYLPGERADTEIALPDDLDGDEEAERADEERVDERP